MAPTPIVPTYRITFPYQCGGFPHVQHLLLNVVASGDPSGFDAAVRPGFSHAGVTAAMTAVWNAWKAAFSSTQTIFGNAHLDQFIGGAWVPLFYETNAVTPTGSGGSTEGQETIMSGYSTLHERMKFPFLETRAAGLGRSISYASTTASEQPLVDKYFNGNNGAGASDPYAWALSRAGDPIGTFISIVDSYNKHWRRKRNLG